MYSSVVLTSLMVTGPVLSDFGLLILNGIRPLDQGVPPTPPPHIPLHH
jgi:hypothetical protein